MAIRKQTLRDIALASLLWLGLGASLGLYYIIANPAAGGWPMPQPESLAGLMLFRFSNASASALVQTIHWLLVFPAAGLIWVAVLTVTAPYFDGRRALFGYAVYRFGLATIPLSLPVFWLLYVAGKTNSGYSLEQLMNVILRREFVPFWQWTSLIYAGAAVISLLIQLHFYRVAFDVKGKNAVKHYTGGLIATLLIAGGLGALLAAPIGAWLG